MLQTLSVITLQMLFMLKQQGRKR